MRLGFVGLGNMGGGLAAHLLRNGHELKVYDIRCETMARFQDLGAVPVDRLEDVASGSDAIFTSLPWPSDVHEVIVERILPMLANPLTFIDVSTIDPRSARQIKASLAARGHSFLACPLGKGPVQAADGSEPIFCGGDRQVFERWCPLLEEIGNPVYFLGDVEQSTAFKLISNLIGMTNLAVLAEGLALGNKAGIPMELLQQLLANTGAMSYQLELRGPWIRAGDFAPRFSVDLTLKDLTLATRMAKTLNGQVPFGQLAVQCYQVAHDEGFGAKDAGAVFKTLDPP